MSSWAGKDDKSEDPESECDRSDDVGVETPSGSIYGDCTSMVLGSIFSKSRSKGPVSFAADPSIGR
jgi:hypothetical protein